MSKMVLHYPLGVTLESPTQDASRNQLRAAASPFVDGLADRLSNLCRATGLSVETTLAADSILRDLIVPWSRVEAFAQGAPSSWVSEISDDNTPIEFSVTISPAGSEVRVLFEPQAEDATLAGHRQSALRMHDVLAEQFGADLTRFKLVQDLLAPPDMQGPFALWSAVVFADGKPPSFKAYFNPQAQGAGSAVRLVEEGLRRLGLKHAWGHLAATVARRGPHRDELKYFALDLSSGDQARVKVYVRHHDATPDDLERAASAVPGSTRGEGQEFARAMGGGAWRFKERATFTCAAFVGGHDDRPSATTQYVPVCAYAIDDQEVERRVSKYLEANDMDATPYQRVLSAFATRALDAGVGMQSWVAFRRYQGVPRLTVYLGTETRCVFPPGSVPAGTQDHLSFTSASDVLGRVAQYPLSRHPLVCGFSRLRSQGTKLGLLVSNTVELLARTQEHPEARLELEAWLASNPLSGGSLATGQHAARHLFAEALAGFVSSPDGVEATAALSAAATAARALAATLIACLQLEAASSLDFSEEGAAGPPYLGELDAVGSRGLPSIARGALGVHQGLWSALDQLELLSVTETTRPPQGD